jgi:negative regulator of sigma E activity
MAGQSTNCARFREWMADAADAALSARLRADFDAHLRDCVACREEVQRVQTVLQEINANLSATVAAEPSPQLIAGVQQRIADQPQPHRAPWWLPRNAWLTTAGACAVLAIFLLAVPTMHKSNQPPRGSARNEVPSLSTPNQPTAPPTRGPIASSASTQPRKPTLIAARHSSRALHRPAPEPEIIVDASQMQAILRFAAAMQRGQINGAKLSDAKKASESLEIKPLKIAPLSITALSDESNPLISDTGQDGEKNAKGESR